MSYSMTRNGATRGDRTQDISIRSPMLFQDMYVKLTVQWYTAPGGIVGTVGALTPGRSVTHNTLAFRTAVWTSCIINTIILVKMTLKNMKKSKWCKTSFEE